MHGKTVAASGYGVYGEATGNGEGVHGVSNKGIAGRFNLKGAGSEILLVEDGGAPAFVVRDGGNVGVGINPPTSVLHFMGAMATSVITVTNFGSTTLTASNSIVLADVSSGPVNITLPLTSSCPGRIYFIRRKPDISLNFVSLTATAPNQIEGAGSYSFNGGAGIKGIVIVSDGMDGWWIIADHD